MKLSIIGSGSKGNGYVLQNENEALVIEAGMSYAKLMESVSFNLDKIAGCIVTHEHGDHAKHAEKYISSGIDVFMSDGTSKYMKSGKTAMSKLSEYSKTNLLVAHVSSKIGNFTVYPFEVNHDAAEPLGFLIHHEDIGNVLFITDTYFTQYKFENLNHLIIEANFCKEIVKDKLANNTINPYVYHRLFKSHMSIQSTIELLNANELKDVKNIVLIHLSDRNSNAADFKKQVQELTGLPTVIAESNVEVDLIF